MLRSLISDSVFCSLLLASISTLLCYILFYSKELVFLPCFLWTPGKHWRSLGTTVFRVLLNLQSHYKESTAMNDWPPPNKRGFTSRAWFAGLLLGLLFDQILPRKPENSYITPYNLLVTFQKEINQFSSCFSCWSSGAGFHPLLSQEWMSPILLVVIAGGAKHQGSVDVGEGAVRGKVLSSSAFLFHSALRIIVAPIALCFVLVFLLQVFSG